MSDPQPRHPFLDDLAADVVFTSSVLRAPVIGRDRVTRIVRTGGALYQRQTPIFLGHVEDRGFFEYEVEFDNGDQAQGLVSFRRDSAGEITHLHIAFSPLGAVLHVAAALRDQLTAEFGKDFFL